MGQGLVEMANPTWFKLYVKRGGGGGRGEGGDGGRREGPEGFWKAYPPLKKLNLGLVDMTNPSWFKTYVKRGGGGR
jgi:hypothetical protein